MRILLLFLWVYGCTFLWGNGFLHAQSPASELRKIVDSYQNQSDWAVRQDSRTYSPTGTVPSVSSVIELYKSGEKMFIRQPQVTEMIYTGEYVLVLDLTSKKMIVKQTEKKPASFVHRLDSLLNQKDVQVSTLPVSSEGWKGLSISIGTTSAQVCSLLYGASNYRIQRFITRTQQKRTEISYSELPPLPADKFNLEHYLRKQQGKFTLSMPYSDYRLVNLIPAP